MSATCGPKRHQLSRIGCLLWVRGVILTAAQPLQVSANERTWSDGIVMAEGAKNGALCLISLVYWRIFARVEPKRMVPWIPYIFARNDGSSWPLFLQLNNSEEFPMPVILWLLGVPLSVIVIAALFGAF
jgi:hypothetical protein